MESRFTSLYRHILDSLYDGVYFVDKQRKIRFWNEGAVRLTGYRAEEVVGRFCHDNILEHICPEGKLLCLDGCPLQQTIDDGGFKEMTAFLRQKNGTRRSVKIRSTPFHNEEGEIIGAVEIFYDNSSELSLLNRLKELNDETSLDHLTGIGNRRSLEAHIERKLSEMEDRGWSFGIAFIDIDDFKRINDLHGHETGDKALKLVADTLKTSIRSFDFIGRWGGEEFVSVLSEKDIEGLSNISNRHRRLIEESYVLAGNSRVSFTASFGITMARHHDSVMSLVNRADTLMYNSKQAGKNRITSG